MQVKLTELKNKMWADKEVLVWNHVSFYMNKIFGKITQGTANDNYSLEVDSGCTEFRGILIMAQYIKYLYFLKCELYDFNV